ncbi:MAG: hypothetical protein E3I25_01645 [Dehalococcoidia bacterium]|nr:MAG: hypothetical protein E3J60_01950 [Dehalococcoidia bacterium]TEU18167.1 MAG: hypothetical protein E3I25_01645 [Dehalococcoidia bacterium]
MSCLVLLLLTAVIAYFGATIAFFLAAGMIPLAILSLVLIPLAILFTWRIIYPWLVRMGRWSAQLRNIAFLAFVLLAIGMGVGYIPGINVPTVTIPLIGIELPITVLVFGLLFLFLLLLGLVVWLVRIWRRGWPTVRDFFWDISFRTVALLWKILVGIPLGITWFLYHPPLRWLIAALIFYLRGISAAVAWLLYNPPLSGIAIAIVVITRLIGRVVAFLIYNPPILWLIQFGLFILRLIARVMSSIIYHIWSWWPVTGVKGTLRKGLNAESKSYQDYKYA